MASSSIVFSLSTGITTPSSSVRRSRATFRAQIVSSLKSANASLKTAESSVERRSANYAPSIWEDSYIQSLPIEFLEEDIEVQIKELKDYVAQLIQIHRSVDDHQSQLQLVDQLHQLGLSYHFKNEIKDALSTIHKTISDSSSKLSQYDINSTSLLFRLLREFGFHVSTDIFNRFKDEKGMFKPTTEDIECMLNLYEASFYKKAGESELDEARNFAAARLSDFAGSSGSGSLQKERVDYALELPLQQRLQRLHHRWYIKTYERAENMNPKLLKLAKLDFNRVQNIHRRELKELSRWWKNLALKDAMPFARDRLVENFLLSVAYAYEPEYWRSREAMTWGANIVSYVDDVYDVYGSLEELELFTDAIDRWDATAIGELPNYMKICFMALFNTVNETAYKTMKLKGVDTLPVLKKAWVDICKAYLVEARWYYGGYTPKFKEYLENAWLSVTGHIAIMNAFCTSEDLTQEAIDSFTFYPPAVRHSAMVFRLRDDLGTSSAEIERGDVAKCVQIYMNEFGVSEEVARQKVKDMINSTWEDLNAECISVGSSHVGAYEKVVRNMPRMAQSVYQHGDGYGVSGEHSKDKIEALFAEPIRP